MALIVLSCNKDGVIVAEGGVPEITLDSTTGVYTVKVGESLTIAPTYKNVDSTTAYSWSIDGVVVSTSSSYTFTPQQSGEVFITLEVANIYGVATEDLRVDVTQLQIPTVTIAASEQMSLAVGSTYHLRASVKQPTYLQQLSGGLTTRR